METLNQFAKEYKTIRGPHSLGTLIEWKQNSTIVVMAIVAVLVPTRWGH